MNLKLKHITFIITSFLLVACAMESKSPKNWSIEESKDYEHSNDTIHDYDYNGSSFRFSVIPSSKHKLVEERLQDFYDLMALQNEHPEFMNEVSNQLKNFTTDSISEYKTDDFVVVKNIRQAGKAILINDSVQKIKLIYDKVVSNVTTLDTIYAIITKKTITIDSETLVSNKVKFSKN